MFWLKCIFVIDVAVKQLRSRSFLKCGVSAVTMAARNFFFKSNQTLIILVSLNSLLYRNVGVAGLDLADWRLGNAAPKKRCSDCEPLATLCPT